MKIKQITEQEFNHFSINHKYHSYYQTSSYGNLMSNYGLNPLYLGIYENSQLIGASLILSKPTVLGFKYGYAPRGLLIDYEDYTKVIEIINDLKSYLLKDRFVLLKIDPLVIKSIRKSDGTTLEGNYHYNNIIDTLKEAGFFHCGFSSAFESVKPRWQAILELNQEKEKLFNSFSKQVRSKIRKASRLGIEIIQDNNALEKIYSFIEKKGNYSYKYYKDLTNYFDNKLEIYIAKLNTEQYVEGSREAYEKELEYNNYLSDIIGRDGYKGKNMKEMLNKKIESDKLLAIYKNYLVNSIELLKNNPDGIIIGGTIIIKSGNTINLLMEGYDPNFSKYNSLYLSKWEIIKKYLNSKYEYFNMNAIVDNFDKQNEQYKGLNDAKLGFSTKAYEFIGEFNLIINSPIYSLYKNSITKDSIKNIKK